MWKFSFFHLSLVSGVVSFNVRSILFSGKMAEAESLEETSIGCKHYKRKTKFVVSTIIILNLHINTSFIKNSHVNLTCFNKFYYNGIVLYTNQIISYMI